VTRLSSVHNLFEVTLSVRANATERLLNILEMLSRNTAIITPTLFVPSLPNSPNEWRGNLPFVRRTAVHQVLFERRRRDKLLDSKSRWAKDPVTRLATRRRASRRRSPLRKYDRWLAYAPAAVAIGARSIFAFPLE